MLTILLHLPTPVTDDSFAVHHEYGALQSVARHAVNHQLAAQLPRDSESGSPGSVYQYAALFKGCARYLASGQHTRKRYGARALNVIIE